jgi:UDP-GlcNAc3NAcA epimerase
MKILTVIGARPQFIKASALSSKLNEYKNVEEVLLHTGQHYDDNMSKVFFDELNITKPKYNLNIKSSLHGEQTGNMIIGIEKIILSENPDIVLVYGDTNSTVSAAMAAAKLHIPIAHVEAGLRSFNKRMPEEINRIITDHVSTKLFTPTITATQNLIREGINRTTIKEVGDVMFDATILFSKLAEEHSNIKEKIDLRHKYILATIHRAENTDDELRLKSIFKEFDRIASIYDLILPLHPRTKKKLENIRYNFSDSQIKFLEPVSYLDMLILEKNAILLMTDSGGMQKEAYFNQVPCITIRAETEWIELVHKGYNRLALNNSEDNLLEIIEGMLQTNFHESDNMYGDGNASKKIIEDILSL